MLFSIPSKVCFLYTNCYFNNILKFNYIFKAIGVVCYGKRLNCFSNNSEDYRVNKAIVQANVKFLKALGETFHQPPWWKLWRTKAYKIIESTQDFMMGLVNYDQLFKKKKSLLQLLCCFSICRTAVKYLQEARQKLIENPDRFLEEDPILYHLLENRNLSETEKNLLVTEVFQGGIDAVIIHVMS